MKELERMRLVPELVFYKEQQFTRQKDGTICQQFIFIPVSGGKELKINIIHDGNERGMKVFEALLELVGFGTALEESGYLAAIWDADKSDYVALGNMDKSKFFLLEKADEDIGEAGSFLEEEQILALNKAIIRRLDKASLVKLIERYKRVIDSNKIIVANLEKILDNGIISE